MIFNEKFTVLTDELTDGHFKLQSSFATKQKEPFDNAVPKQLQFYGRFQRQEVWDEKITLPETKKYLGTNE